MTGALASATLTKDGLGTLTLAADDSALAEKVNVKAGKLVVTNVNALGATGSTSDTTVQFGGQLALSNVVGTVQEQIRLNGTGLANDGR